MSKYSLWILVSIVIVIVVAFTCIMSFVSSCNQDSIDRWVGTEIKIKILERDMLKRFNKNTANDLVVVKTMNRIVNLIDQLHPRKGEPNELDK